MSRARNRTTGKNKRQKTNEKQAKSVGTHANTKVNPPPVVGVEVLEGVCVIARQPSPSRLRVAEANASQKRALALELDVHGVGRAIPAVDDRWQGAV